MHHTISSSTTRPLPNKLIQLNTLCTLGIIALNVHNVWMEIKDKENTKHYKGYSWGPYKIWRAMLSLST